MVYSIIRFVPDPARGESVNLGVLVSNGTDDWACRWTENLKRARAISTPKQLNAAVSILDDLEEILGDQRRVKELTPDIGSDWILEEANRRNNLIQLSPPLPVAAGSVTEAIDKVFSRMVVDLPDARRRVVRKTAAVSATAKAFQQSGISPAAVTRKATVLTGKQDVQFDFLVHNGKPVQLTKCWSFDLVDQERLLREINAWSWVVGQIREEGGSVETEDGPKINEELPIAAVYIKPRSGDSEALEAAKESFDHLDVTAVDAGSVLEIAHKAATLLEESHAEAAQGGESRPVG